MNVLGTKELVGGSINRLDLLQFVRSFFKKLSRFTEIKLHTINPTYCKCPVIFSKSLVLPSPESSFRNKFEEIVL